MYFLPTKVHTAKLFFTMLNEIRAMMKSRISIWTKFD